jgi:photosystem II stability/assembly factor-like uncharacterized protein
MNIKRIEYMKKILSLVGLMLIVVGMDVFAQGTTMTIGTVTAQPGAAISVPINVGNFRNVGSISLKISYSTTVLTFDSLSNAPPNVSFIYNAVGGVLTVAWFDPSGNQPINLGTGTLVNMRFRYTAGSTPVSFITSQCQITDSLGQNIAVTYTNGSVSPSPVTLTIGTVSGTVGQPVNVPINVQGFSKIGALTLKITFSTPAITFVDTVNTAAGISFTKNVVGNVITLLWFDATGRGVTLTTGGKLVDLRFNYAGGTGNITWNTTECEVADSAGVPLTVNYVNGRVQPTGSAPITTSLQNVVRSAAGRLVVPITVTNFNNVGAITLKLNYNGVTLSFDSLSNPPRTGFVANQNAGTLTILWFDATTTNPIRLGTAATTLLNLNFTYAPSGSTTINFLTAECEYADSAGTVLSGNTFVNGSVTYGNGWTDQLLPSTAIGLIYSVKAVDANVVWAGAAGGRMLRTTNGGTAWTVSTITGPGTGAIYAIEAIARDTAFATTSPDTTHIFRTTNGGTSWTRVYSQPGGFLDAMKMYNSTNGIALGDPVAIRVGGPVLWTILRTSNGGASWLRDTTNAPRQVGTEAGWNNSMATNGNIIWFGTSASRIYRSFNSGTTWDTTRVPFVNVYSIAFNANASFGVAGASNGAAVQTTNAGTTWTTVTIGTGTSPINGISGAVYDFFACKGPFVYRSTDRGATWTQSYYPPGGLSLGVGTMQHVSFFAPNVTTTYGWSVTTTGGITSFTGILTGVGPPGNQIPTEFAVMQNYPNPFNPSTTIQYALPKDARITLAIYNVLGQKIAELRNEVQNVGYHEAVWNGTNAAGVHVASGIYMYRLEAKPLDGSSSFTSLNKMLLLK